MGGGEDDKKRGMSSSGHQHHHPPPPPPPPSAPEYGTFQGVANYPPPPPHGGFPQPVPPPGATDPPPQYYAHGYQSTVPGKCLLFWSTTMTLMLFELLIGSKIGFLTVQEWITGSENLFCVDWVLGLWLIDLLVTATTLLLWFYICSTNLNYWICNWQVCSF